jgi:hypothetical protein
MTTNEQDTTAADLAWAKLARRIALAAVAIPLLGIGACAVLIASDDGKDADPTAAAITSCREAVKAQLKSPSTARFTEEYAVKGKTFGTTAAMTVTGNVDSENSFSATVRLSYTCRAAVDQGRTVSTTATLTE